MKMARFRKMCGPAARTYQFMQNAGGGARRRRQITF
jgi:hypothetical protein